MSIPLDRLYNFLRDIRNQDELIIYRFFPHGSKKITDLKRLVPDQLFYDPNRTTHTPDFVRQRCVFFHDQEPLNFDLYSTMDVANQIFSEPDAYKAVYRFFDDFISGLCQNYLEKTMAELNFKVAVGIGKLWKVPVLLVHSEKRSSNLARYEMIDYIGVYWWAHAVIARDWFRYAEHDPNLQIRNVQKDFLIYNRAWSGTREYRLKFAELLVENALTSHCHMGFNCQDTGDYRQHQFTNPVFQISRQDLESHFFYNDTPATASADYNGHDYQSTEIEVVLETLFDDDRLQLTEKILRPIACGQPFILVSTQHSLQYLRDYGFQTFGDYIDESYDTVADPGDRLQAVIAELRRIANLDPHQKQTLYAGMRKTAEYNRQIFFSSTWHKSIIDEFKHNFQQAIVEHDQKRQKPINQI